MVGSGMVDLPPPRHCSGQHRNSRTPPPIRLRRVDSICPLHISRMRTHCQRPWQSSKYRRGIGCTCRSRRCQSCCSSIPLGTSGRPQERWRPLGYSTSPQGSGCSSLCCFAPARHSMCQRRIFYKVLFLSRSRCPRGKSCTDSLSLAFHILLGKLHPNAATVPQAQQGLAWPQ